MSDVRLFEAKIITLGDSKVGKTCLIGKFIDNKFAQNYLSTIGFDIRQKKIKLDNGKEIKVVLYDTAGQEKFRSLSTSYIKKAQGVLLIYDITDPDSFAHISSWVDDINSKCKEKIPVVLIGNKSDLEQNRKVKAEDGKALGEKYGYNFYETSCKNGNNVNKSFKDIVNQVYDKYGGIVEQNKVLQHSTLKSKKEAKCC